ncbi:MAG: polysaccharide biosynthesis/export family protein [Planctomycetia bacterium]|nr:polysaccharide biosynthesis/export family protein [Planctomycetia bacterium]
MIRPGCGLFALPLLLTLNCLAYSAEPADRPIRAGNTLCISAQNVYPDHPIDGAFVVDRDGKIDLGEPYGQFAVAGITATEVQQRLQKQLEKDLFEPKITCCDICDAGSSPCQTALQNKHKQASEEQEKADEAAKKALAKAQVPDQRALSCTIQASSECEIGNAPQITVEITNSEKNAVYLVKAVDGSDGGRYPMCMFKVTGPNGKSAVPSMGRCGVMGPLSEPHFVRVPPGKSFNPYNDVATAVQVWKETFSREGEYRVQFTYSTFDKGGGRWWGTGQQDPGKRLVALLEKVPKLTVLSNEITIKMVRPKK